MTTCENCGADTVDARGVCRTCGWRVGDEMTLDDESPSLGETRAADAAELARGGAQWSSSAAPSRTAQHGASGGGTPPAPRSGGGVGTARYCGTCGARLEPGEAFCGQCGTPVGTGGDYTRNVPAGPASRYYVGGTGNWSGANGDAYTEEYTAPPLPPAAPYNRPSSPGGGFMPGTYGAPAVGSSPESRAGRVVFGLLCILGSLISAAGAVYLALAH